MVSGLMQNPLKPFGVEVKVDGADGVTAPDFNTVDKDTLCRLYARDGLILIRDLRLTMDAQLDVCNIFGPVLRGSRENYLVSNVHKEGLLGDGELRFHNDVPFVPAPYLGGSLHALEISGGVSATRFASGLRAYERLPKKLRERIDGLNALHVRERAVGRRTRLTDLQPTDLGTVHPVVGRQDGTGRPYLFVNQSMTALIIGLSEPDSDALLEELFAYLYVEEDIYEHAWKQGDIVIWDNLSLQHARKPFSGGARTLQRVTIAALGYWDQYPVDLPTYDALHTFKEQPAA